MGLDQYAYIKTSESGDEGETPKFVWRKHSKLQSFMEALYEDRTGLSASDLNCGELALETGDIDTLEQSVKDSALPQRAGGFANEPRLDHGADATEYWQNGTRVEDLSEAFAGFRENGKKVRNAKITEAIARTLPYQAGSPEFFGLIAEETGADIRKHWTPTAENFFSRVAASNLTNLLCEFLDCDARDERVAAFAKLKKAEKAEKMEKLVSDATTQKLMKVSPEQKAKLDKWVPDCT